MRLLHLTVAFVVGGCLIGLGGWFVGTMPLADHLGLGLSLLWGVVVGMSVVAYWEEVIDR